MPFLILAPKAAACVRQHLRSHSLQISSPSQGNYAFFNLLTVALCLFLLDDAFFRRRLPGSIAEPNSSCLLREQHAPLSPPSHASRFICWCFSSVASNWLACSRAYTWAAADKVIAGRLHLSKSSIPTACSP